MKCKLLTIALIATLPVVAMAQEQAEPTAKPAPKEHRMQNSDPTPSQQQATEHAVSGQKETAEKPQHTMKNN